MSNSNFSCIVAVDDKTSNVGEIHYLKNIESTQLQALQLNAAETYPAGIQQFFCQESENEEATIVGQRQQVRKHSREYEAIVCWGIAIGR